MLKIQEIIKLTKNLKLLYIEDNFDIRNNMIKIFSNYFEYFDTAVDGIDGLNKYKIFYQNHNNFYDLIIFDIGLPKMDGISMMKEILLLNPSQTSIVISAYDHPEKLQNLMDIGVLNLIPKPFTYEKLNISLINAIESISYKKELFKKSNFKESSSNKNTLKLDITILNNLKSKIHKLNIYNADEKLQNNLDELANLKYESIYKILNTYSVALKQISQKLEKEIYSLDIMRDNKLVILPKLRPFIKSLIHMFKNCVDHGIEDINIKTKNTKDKICTVTCKYFVVNNHLQIIISDNGHGIDIESLYKSDTKIKLLYGNVKII